MAGRRATADVINGRGCSNRGEDPLSLCHLGRLLIAPRRRHRHATFVLQPTSSDGRASSCSSGPETENDVLAAPPTEEEFILPSVESKDEARRLFLRALASAEERRECAVNDVSRTNNVRKWSVGGVSGDGGGGGRRDIIREDEVMDGLLAQVHLEVSECNRFLGAGGGRITNVDCDAASERHLREAAKAAPDTKTGLTARRDVVIVVLRIRMWVSSTNVLALLKCTLKK